MGKLKHRAGFLESLQGEEAPVYRDQVGFLPFFWAFKRRAQSTCMDRISKNSVHMDQACFLVLLLLKPSLEATHRFMVKSG